MADEAAPQTLGELILEVCGIAEEVNAVAQKLAAKVIGEIPNPHRPEDGNGPALKSNVTRLNYRLASIRELLLRVDGGL